MVKLLRISSENNGTFQADLDAEINIKESASIALQNLTFETQDFTAFRVGDKNSEVQFDFGEIIRTKFLKANLKIENYTKATINNFYQNLQDTLNRCLGVGPSSDAAVDRIGNAYATFMVRYDTENIFPPPSEPVEKNSIIYKLSPMIMPFNFNDTGDPRGNDGKELFDASRTDQNVPSLVITIGDADENNLGNMKQNPTGAATSLYTNYIYPQIFVEWSLGSAMWMCGINSLTANAGASNTNGFAIGLSFTNLIGATNLGTIEIPITARDFEVRVEKPTDFYSHLIPTNNGIHQISAFTPFSVAGDPLDNDHILFEKKEGKIIASVLDTSTGGGRIREFFSYTLSDDEMSKPLYPYISVMGAAADCVVGRPIVTLNPFFYPVTNNLQPLDNRYYQYTGINQSLVGGPNGYNSLTNMSDVVPYSEDDIFESEDVAKTNFNPKLIVNEEVLKVLGFDATNFTGNTAITIQRPQTLLTIDDNGPLPFLQFDIISQGLNNLVNSDNYIVILDSNPLYSYDASKFDYTDPDNINFKTYSNRGRRLNILATIPINDNSGIVEYEPNELTFIDFDNRFPQSLKNIKLRVLDKDFNEIRTKGESILTLLIKDN